jgi:hypothetical protein
MQDPDPYVIKSFFLGDFTLVATFKLHSNKNISGYFGSVKDTSFTVGLQNIAPEDVDRVVNIIEDTLAAVEAEGFPQQRIAAVLHSYELSLKHRSLAVLRPPGSGSGSVGSVCFWASWIRIRLGNLFVRIRILPSTSKIKLRKTLIS